MQMEQALAPLKKRLISERLIEPDWPDIVSMLERIGKKEGLTADETVTLFYGRTMSQNLVDEITLNERRRHNIRDAARKLNLDRLIIEMFKGNMFLAGVSRYIRKTRGTSWKGFAVPTAAMCYNMEFDDFELVWNPEFLASFIVDHGEVEGSKMIQFVYGHELFHFILKHITVRRRTPHFGWNIGTDAANNSLLVHMGMTLPPCGVYPSRVWGSPPPRLELRTGMTRRQLTVAEAAMVKGLGDLVGKWRPMETSEWYFNDLMKWAKDNGHGVGNKGIFVVDSDGDGEELEGVFDDMDVHDIWDEMPAPARERITEKLRQVMKDAARRADNEVKGWGNIPSDIQRDIRSFINNSVDWEKVLAQFFGSFNRGRRVKTIKKVNKKYEYIHAGHKKMRMPRMVIAIDESGSVSDEWIALMFGVITKLSKLIDFTVIFFDETVDENHIIEWRRGAPIPKSLKRVKNGGTNFNAPVQWVNRPGNRSKYDGMVILTDGGAGMPGLCRVKKAYVLVPGCELFFKTRDLVIKMEESGRKRDGTIR